MHCHAAECRGEASQVLTKLDGNVCDQHLHRRMGSGARIRVRWMGKHDKLCEAGGLIWSICQVLPMQASSSSSSLSWLVWTEPSLTECDQSLSIFCIIYIGWCQIVHLHVMCVGFLHLSLLLYKYFWFFPPSPLLDSKE